jgi:uncharacterized membrane protein
MLEYGVIFWGNSPYSKQFLQIQKKILRIMKDSLTRASYKSLFRNLEIQNFLCQYILPVSMFFVSNNTFK